MAGHRRERVHNASYVHVEMAPASDRTPHGGAPTELQAYGVDITSDEQRSSETPAAGLVLVRYNTHRVPDHAHPSTSPPMTEPSLSATRGPDAAARAALHLRARAADTAVAVADRLADPAALPVVTAASAQRVGVRDYWEPLSLMTGYPGIAILHAQTGDPEIAYTYLRAARHVDPGPAETSVFHGYGAFVAAVAVVTRATGGYEQLLRQGQRWLADTAVTVVRDLRERLARGEWPDHRQWDTLLGVTGPGRLLLDAVTDGRDEQLPALQEVLQLLVELAQPRAVRSAHPAKAPASSPATTRPGWWTPAPESARWCGAAELGAAHGICGPLALLALAGSADVWVAGQADAIARIAEGLLAWRTAQHRWPKAVFHNVYRPAGPDLADASWAEGTAGIARALWLAGIAIDDARLRAAGVDALAELDREAPAGWPLQGPTVWRGRAGLLAIATRIAAESADRAVIRLAEHTACALLADFREDAPWGYQHVLTSPGPGAAAVDVPGLLTGAAGIALALREWADATPPLHPPALSQGRLAAGPPWGMPLLID